MNQKPKHEIVQFIKKGRKGRVGCVVAVVRDFPYDTFVSIGWSLQNKVDRINGKFNAKRALEMATGRAKESLFPAILPPSIAPQVKEFAEKVSSKYFRMSFKIWGQ